ncbi:MAG: hypothetical protein EOP09_03250 [Proteobacteria bacterium]|nr:MAG: hypothetical protein EOP09_03250 [Pseudomonadota bacterium]
MKKILMLIVLSSLSSVSAHAVQLKCQGNRQESNQAGRKYPLLVQVVELQAVIRQPHVLELVHATVNQKVMSTAADPVEFWSQNHQAPRLEAVLNQPNLTRGYQNADAYVINDESCFGSPIEFILPNNLHRLRAGVKFPARMNPNITLNCETL